jgi:alkaline phosphatase D
MTARFRGIMLLLVCVAAGSAGAEGSPFLAEGFKIGEVTSDAAIIWTRLSKTQHCDPETWALPGMPGEIRVVWQEAEGAAGETRETPWTSVDPERDFTCQVHLTGLKPATTYSFHILCRSAADQPERQSNQGSFTTAPPADAPLRVTFVVTTGHKYATIDDPGKGQKIYPSMLALKPDFFVHTGDIVYYDNDVTIAHNADEARSHWHRMYNLPYQQQFHAQVASYFIKDDHDTLKNDCWPGQTFHQLTFAEGQAIFLEQVPMGESTYRTMRWGKDLQVWLPEGRDFRSPNTMEDGPDKTIWGREQIAWFARTVDASDATFRVLISPTPVVGPDRPNKRDNHANAAFETEGSRLRAFMADRKNMVVITGDRHWQYVSVDPATGLREYSCGPSTDAHAGGWKASDRTDIHSFLRIQGGFLSATVDRLGGEVRLTLCHHAVDGSVVHTDVQIGG